jgi:hypothetical protein
MRIQISEGDDDKRHSVRQNRFQDNQKDSRPSRNGSNRLRNGKKFQRIFSEFSSLIQRMDWNLREQLLWMKLELLFMINL